jgi:hypothetical protein
VLRPLEARQIPRFLSLIKRPPVIPSQKSDRPTSRFLLHFAIKRTTPRNPQFGRKSVANWLLKADLMLIKGAGRETAS